MSLIIDAKTVFPENEYEQTQLYDFLSTLWPENKRMIQKFHESVLVQKRATCIPLQEIGRLTTFAQRNRIWKEQALQLSKQAVTDILTKNDITPQDIGLLVTTSVTGFSIPSLDALLMNELQFSAQTKRLPLFGFGCLGGCASLNRAHDYLQLHKDKLALVVGVELCSLTFQLQDKSVPNFVATALFGDGAAAVLLAGEDHPLAKQGKFQIDDYESFFYPNTQDTMGWNIVDTGFQIILSGDVSELVEKEILQNTKFLLNKNKLPLEEMKFVISHPGGPKVLSSLARAVGMQDEDFSHSWASLAEHGNMSSVSVLNVLERSIKSCNGKTNEHGLLMAMGPAFNCEITLLKKVG